MMKSVAHHLLGAQAIAGMEAQQGPHDRPTERAHLTCTQTRWFSPAYASELYLKLNKVPALLLRVRKLRGARSTFAVLAALIADQN